MPATITRPEALSDEQINGLDASQLRSEIKLRYDYAADIEKRYASSEANQDKADEDEVKRLLGTIDKLEDRLSPFEEAEQRRQRIFGNVERYNERAGRGHKHATRYADEEPVGSIGQQLVEAAQYKSLTESGLLRNSANRVELTVPMFFHPDVLVMLRDAGKRTAVLFTESPYEDEQQARMASLVDMTS